MTADTLRLVEKLCDFIRVDSVTHEVRHYLFTPAQIEALAAALQGRAQEGEPSDERAAFEAWARSDGYRVERAPEPFVYDMGSTACVWKAWQARAALAQGAKP